MWRAQTSDAQKCHFVAFHKESEVVTRVLLSAITILQSSCFTLFLQEYFTEKCDLICHKVPVAHQQTWRAAAPVRSGVRVVSVPIWLWITVPILIPGLWRFSSAILSHSHSAPASVRTFLSRSRAVLAQPTLCHRCQSIYGNTNIVHYSIQIMLLLFIIIVIQLTVYLYLRKTFMQQLFTLIKYNLFRYFGYL